MSWALYRYLRSADRAEDLPEAADDWADPAWRRHRLAAGLEAGDVLARLYWELPRELIVSGVPLAHVEHLQPAHMAATAAVRAGSSWHWRLDLPDGYLVAYAIVADNAPTAGDGKR